jgi:hypothetical protein
MGNLRSILNDRILHIFRQEGEIVRVDPVSTS